MSSNAHAVLTSHVLDMVSGLPAGGVPLSLFRVDAGEKKLLVEAVTNSDGRCDAPLLTSDTATRGRYRLEFAVGEYLQGAGGFFDRVPVEFSISDIEGHYHVPLVISPFGFSSYRGSPASRPANDGGEWRLNSAPAAYPADQPTAPPPGQGGAGLTVHIIDIARGCGGGPVKVDVYKVSDDVTEKVAEGTTTLEGRTPEWLIPAGGLNEGTYEMAFHLGDYFKSAGFGIGSCRLSNAPWCDSQLPIRIDTTIFRCWRRRGGIAAIEVVDLFWVARVVN